MRALIMDGGRADLGGAHREWPIPLDEALWIARQIAEALEPRIRRAWSVAT
jgi:hypothetical protein